MAQPTLASNIPTDLQTRLIEAAISVRQKAHAPYSHFLVGAALLTDTNEIVSGCNVENASYGLTVCAERSAVFASVSAGHRQFRLLALATSGGVTPCGACRQVLAEFCDDLPILIINTDDPGHVSETSLDILLPSRFIRQSRGSNDEKR